MAILMAFRTSFSRLCLLAPGLGPLLNGLKDRGESIKGHPFAQRLKHATTGLVEAWRRERSFRSQTILAAAAVTGGVVLRAELIWWAALVVVIALVLVAEMVNSSIEALADHLHPSVHPSIRTAKDMAAAAVLLASLAAVTVGACFVLSTL